VVMGTMSTGSVEAAGGFWKSSHSGIRVHCDPITTQNARGRAVLAGTIVRSMAAMRRNSCDQSLHRQNQSSRGCAGDAAMIGFGRPLACSTQKLAKWPIRRAVSLRETGSDDVVEQQVYPIVSLSRLTCVVFRLESLTYGQDWTVVSGLESLTYGHAHSRRRTRVVARRGWWRRGHRCRWIGRSR